MQEVLRSVQSRCGVSVDSDERSNKKAWGLFDILFVQRLPVG